MLGFGWRSGDLTMADMSICWRAEAGVAGACSGALKWAAGGERVTPNQLYNNVFKGNGSSAFNPTPLNQRSAEGCLYRHPRCPGYIGFTALLRGRMTNVYLVSPGIRSSNLSVTGPTLLPARLPATPREEGRGNVSLWVHIWYTSTHQKCCFMSPSSIYNDRVQILQKRILTSLN